VGTPSPLFRLLCDELVTLLAYEATRHVRVETGSAWSTRLLPTAEVGFLGLVRDETTLQASTYAERLPADLGGRQGYALDPMLATGGTLVARRATCSAVAPNR
jgi:uracil phosphoribosyltransferase